MFTVSYTRKSLNEDLEPHRVSYLNLQKAGSRSVYFSAMIHNTAGSIHPNKAGLFQKEPRNLKSFTAQKGLK